MGSDVKADRDVTPSFDDYTFLNRWSLTFLGIWNLGERPEGRLSRLLHWIHVTVLFVVLILLLIPQWLDIYVFRGNVDANAETFISNVFTITALLKLVCGFGMADVLHDVLSTIKRNWNETMNGAHPRQKKHEQILLHMASRASNYTKQYAAVMYSTAMLYFVSPFVGMQRDNLRIRKYPFFGWYYFDRFSDRYYGLCYAFQIMAGIIVGTTNFAMDSLFLVSLYHCSAQLQILQHDLMKVGETGNDDSSNGLNCLIRKHQREIRNSRKLEAIFNGTSIQQLLVSCIIICVIGLKLIIALLDEGYEFLIYVAFLSLVLLQIFLYCEPGDELLSQSLKVGCAAYQSSWTSLDLKAMRKVTTIILRSQTPLTISAGKVYVLSLQNFSMVMNYNELNIMQGVTFIGTTYENSDNCSFKAVIVVHSDAF